MKRLLLVILVPILFSCEKIFIDKDPDNTATENFEILWATMDERYSFFEYKGIDWDSIKEVYQPQVYDGMSDEELFSVMAEMLNVLKDGHTNLWSEFDISRYFPYLQAPPNFNFDVVEQEYLGDDFLFTGYLLNQVIDSVGYIYYGSFGATVTSEQLDYVLNRFSGLKGVILDIRDNEGGNPANGILLAERMVKEKTHVYTTQTKNGPAHGDFTAPEDVYIYPNLDSPRFPDKTMVLVNRKCYSAANYFTTMMKAIPHVTVIGDTTGGGGGVPAGFELPNGWYFNYSSTIATMPDGFNIEHGVYPDILESAPAAILATGVDPIIERAITEINN